MEPAIAFVRLLANSSPDRVEEGYTLVVVGLFLLIGFAAHALSARLRIPRVTLLMLIGFLAGPSVLNLVPATATAWFPLAARTALSIVGFQLGERFLGAKLRETGKTVLSVSLAEVLAAAAAVFVLLMLAGYSLPLAILLAAVAPASAPASTRDVIQQTQATGPVTETVLGTVAIDDAWGVILFSVLMVAAQAVAGREVSYTVALSGVWEVCGGLALGAVLGLPMAWLTGRVRVGKLTLIEALGFIFFSSGLAIWLHVSYILACIALGATVSNLAKHHERPFHAIEGVEQPFLILFFLLAGFDFEVGQLWNAGLIAALYVMARSSGLVLGGYLGGAVAGASRVVRSHVGWCLLPQAGVALGLALIVSESHPEIGSHVLTVVVATTIIFEIGGPIITRISLRYAGEIPDH